MMKVAKLAARGCYHQSRCLYFSNYIASTGFDFHDKRILLVLLVVKIQFGIPITITSVGNLER
jgi:hypothetical protein